MDNLSTEELSDDVANEATEIVVVRLHLARLNKLVDEVNQLTQKLKTHRVEIGWNVGAHAFGQDRTQLDFVARRSF